MRIRGGTIHGGSFGHEIPGTRTLSSPIATDEPTNVDDTSATLVGVLQDLEGQSSVDCFFEYRIRGENTFTNTTPVQTLSSTGSFSESVAGLNSNTEYWVWAIGDFGSYQQAGDILTFKTDP